MKEAPKRLAPTTNTLRNLFAKSGNLCAFTNCDHPLIDEDENFIAQVCHIEDALPGGRFNKDMTNEERRASDNLVLFCYRHHIQTNNIKKFTVPKLKEIKLQHQSKFNQNFNVEESTLINIFNDLKSIKEYTNQIKNTQNEHSKDLQEITALLIAKQTTPETQDSAFIREIETIVKLKNSENSKQVLELLNNFNNEKWSSLNALERYKLTANIGICYLELDNIDKAAGLFIDSGIYDPENDRALGFAALGYALKGNNKKAREYIKKTIDKNPNNSNAYVAFITIEKGNMGFSEIVTKIPENLREKSEISSALGGLARNNNDYENAINYFQNAVDNAGNNKADLKAMLATAILQSIQIPFQITSGKLNNEMRNKVNYAIKLLTEAWEKFSHTALNKSRAWMLVNRGLARKFLDDLDGAFNDIEQATIISKNSYFALKHLTIAAFQSKKWDQTIQLLERLEALVDNEDEVELEIDLLKAKVFYEKGMFEETINTLLLVLQTSTNQKVIEEAQSTLIFSYLAIKSIEEAKSLSMSIIQEHPEYLRGYIGMARVHSYLNELEEELVFLNSAFEKLNDESNRLDVQDLAYQYVKHNDNLRAIEILEKITNPNIYSDLSRTLLRTYYNAGEMKKALDLCQSISVNYGPIDEITEMLSTVYESIEDFPKAIIVCEEYLAVYPDDQRVQVRLAIIYARIKKMGKVKIILDKLNTLGDLPIDILYQIGFLNITVGEIKRGLEIAFNTRKKYSNNGNSHLKYIGLLTEFKDLKELGVSAEKVELDTVVKIKSNEDDILTYYITDNDSESLPKDELPLTHKLAQKLNGSAVGEIVEIERGFGEAQKFEIVSILSKYTYAFQESIELLNTKFADTSGIKVFNAKTTGNIENDLKPIFSSINEREKFNNQVYEFYHHKFLTIGACSRLLHQNPIKFWSIVYGNPKFGIYSMNATHSGFQLLVDTLLDEEIGIVLDLISLLNLAAINKLEWLEKLSNRKIVARSLIESIDELLREFNGVSSEGYVTIGKENGRFVKEHMTKERIQNLKEHYENLQNWIVKNCEVLPCNEALAMNKYEKEKFDDTLEKIFVDSILVAKEHNCLYFADEASLRAIAFSEFEVRGFPIFTLLSYFRNEKTITQNAFNEEITNLISLGYKYLPVNSEILMRCAESAKFQVSLPYGLAIKTLGVSISSEDSSIQVSSEFIYNLYATIDEAQIRLNLILPLLNVLVNGRDIIIVFKKLKTILEVRLKLFQNQKNEIFLILDEYIKTNT